MKAIKCKVCGNEHWGPCFVPDAGEKARRPVVPSIAPKAKAKIQKPKQRKAS